MGYISINVALTDVAKETKHDVTELINEFGFVFEGDERKIIDPDELDADGVAFIERLHKELTELKATGWTP